MNTHKKHFFHLIEAEKYFSASLKLFRDLKHENRHLVSSQIFIKNDIIDQKK